MYEFTTALAAHIEMHTPRAPSMSNDDLASFLRGRPGYRKSR
jgi:hypothetical protein